MKPANRNRRLFLVGASTVLLSAAVTLIVAALDENVAYFYTPSELAELNNRPDQPIRIGGLVETGSVARGNDTMTIFAISDGKAQIRVEYSGILPDLFREGQGVIAQGRLTGDEIFVADIILAKHDENYVPKELAGVLKESVSEK